jgi:hypothetical protein
MKANEITELLQLESPQSEFCSSGYKINKSGRSAVFNRFVRLYCFSRNSLIIYPNIVNFSQKSVTKFLNFSNWIDCNRSSVARDKIKTVQLTQKAARTDLEFSDLY